MPTVSHRRLTARKRPRRGLAAAQIACVVVAVAVAANGLSPRRALARVDLGALPLVDYDSDVGLGMGANGALFFRQDGWEPYKYAVSGNVYVTTQGVQTHSLKVEAPHWFGSAYRPSVQLRYERDPVRPFYGIGNETEIDRSLDHDLAKQLYRHTLVQPTVSLNVERYQGGPWKVSAGLLGGYQSVTADPLSLLDNQRPSGWNGGTFFELSSDLIYDSRDEEASPTRGVYLALAARAGEARGAHAYAGGGLIARSYLSPFETPALTIASRLIVDALAGDVPFTRLGTFAGRPSISGIGGSLSVRGVPRLLYIGKVKTVANLELRSRLHRFHPGDHTLDLMLAAFGDAGRVWADYAADGPLWRVHASVGGGLRVAWQRDYVVRLDVGRALEGTLGIYLDFSQAF